MASGGPGPSVPGNHTMPPTIRRAGLLKVTSQDGQEALETFPETLVVADQDRV